ncbi:MAG TPA: LacI family DNA-binding transcriptional regulator [Allosphingosinicella sp.]
MADIEPNSLSRRKVTILDVARSAGVSPMTVSRVINRKGRVTDATRALVEERVAAMGYKPNLAARSLAGAGLLHIGVLYSNPSEAYLSRFLLGVLDYARGSVMQAVIERCDGDTDVPALIGSLSRQVEGLLIPPPFSDSESLLSLVRDAGIPAVAIGGHTMVEEVATVCIDDEQAAYEMTRHIVALGHVRIGFVLGQASQSATSLRLAGYRRALREAGLHGSEDLIAQGDFSYRSGVGAAERLLEKANRPTALFASNDDMAAAAVAVAHRLGLSVPRDLTVCGFDDTEMARSIWPELTTVHQPVEDMARAAAALLEKMVKARRPDRRPGVMHRRLGHEIVRRGSEAPPPSARRRAAEAARR